MIWLHLGDWLGCFMAVVKFFSVLFKYFRVVVPLSSDHFDSFACLS